MADQLKKKGASLPALRWGADLRAKPVLPRELIPGILHEGGKMVLGGGSKSFKTWSLADLAMSMAAGVEWWGRPLGAGRVVYLNMEVQAAFFQERLRSIAEAKGIEIPETLGVWNLRGHCAEHSILLPRIQEAMRGERVSAVIIDPLYKLMAGSENDQYEVTGLMNSIERLGEALGAATIFGAHFAKGSAAGKDAIDRISGSGVFARDPDAILTLTKHAEEDTFTVDSILRNCPAVAPFAVRWEFPLMVPSEADPGQLKLPGVAQRKVVDAEMVAEVLRRAGGQLPAWRDAPDGLVAKIQKETGLGRPSAQKAVRAAEGETIQTKRDLVRGTKVYVLKQ